MVRLVKFEAPTRQRSKRYLLQDLGLGWISGVADFATADEVAERRRIDRLHRPPPPPSSSSSSDEEGGGARRRK